MRALALLAIALLQPLAVGLATLAKVIVVFHWTTVRDIATAIAAEVRAVVNADADDWQR